MTHVVLCMSDAEQRMADALDDLNHVFVEFPDLNGLSRSKQLDASYFADRWRDGVSINLSLLTQTARSDVVEGSRYGDRMDYADGLLRPDPTTFRRLPWRDDTARVIGDVEHEGTLVAGAPRTVLKRICDAAADHGLTLTVGSELEFSLLDRATDDYEPTTTEKHECLTTAMEDVSPFYDTLYERAPAFDIDLETFHHEFGAGQLEVLFDYGGPLSEADRTFRFKQLVKRTARDCGHHATFMAKPFTEWAGNGYHLHVGGRRDGVNAFADGEELSETGRQFVAGLLEHADALTALGTPTLNGFKRHQPGTFAPYTASWGYDNRYAAIRIPSQGTVRVENRIASADANPYLVIAATIAAGLDGIERGYELEPASEGDPVGDRPRLPATPRHALDALEADDVLVDALGEPVIGEYARLCRQELERFYEETTVWERNRYAETL